MVELLGRLGFLMLLWEVGMGLAGLFHPKTSYMSSPRAITADYKTSEKEKKTSFSF